MNPIEWKNNILYILDQTKLPWKEDYILCFKYQQVIDAIKKMKIRGAPAIGVAAAYGITLAAIKYTGSNLADYVHEVIGEFAVSRPTAVNLFFAIERMAKVVNSNKNLSPSELKILLLEEAKKIENEEREKSIAISNFGAEILPDGVKVLTHCNTGSLATIGPGTALGIIKEGWKRGKISHVYFTETRPLLQGARLTGWELAKENIPATMITDNMVGYVFSKKIVDLVIVGADRITLRGDVANKIGTYSFAILAKYHNIPFYVAAPISTFDFNLEAGSEIPIEEREQEEVLSFVNKRITPEGISALNPAFDVTPAELISGIVTDKGVIYPPFKENIQKLKEELKL
ncbi:MULTISPECIES: S-methyl-5-thioribose-1-phosphate isomerase [Dictyoglomus]|jgi:methylthioribose-1-phosphate isomerase|uniref:Methylthioribose-1-phosphate isomerase n=1 Tax=Dictyoglomus turgidum (strain DSM 6724 / Z-1310) TaxID=515635 RepID=B8E182_DICTD|nr:MULTISPECIES: S-methyl-5-thioribose-1-phosphate isomerase [Dictyoglomus]ACK42210.1 translation initiation factor, aIF-2BI family [Dictyoglomus turgidum DSM 6724]PNV79857.1 MAG: S-methyl-5-thioribose-1-phosphate isomerase [Dictyoglomus turgidum]HBU32440.1 S-methyl-5-thioribose-1-phosphate isomerase [Dictyoglomus sp.]